MSTICFKSDMFLSSLEHLERLPWVCEFKSESEVVTGSSVKEEGIGEAEDICSSETRIFKDLQQERDCYITEGTVKWTVWVDDREQVWLEK